MVQPVWSVLKFELKVICEDQFSEVIKENEALDQCSMSMMRLDSCELPTMCRCYDLWVLINNQIDGLHSLILLIIC